MPDKQVWSIAEKIYTELPDKEELILGAVVPTLFEKCLPQPLRNNIIIFSGLRDAVKMLPELGYMYFDKKYAGTNYTYDLPRVGSKGLKALTKLSVPIMEIVRNPNMDHEALEALVKTAAEQMLWLSSVAGAGAIEFSKMRQDNKTMDDTRIVVKSSISGTIETITVGLVLPAIELLQIPVFFETLENNILPFAASISQIHVPAVRPILSMILGSTKAVLCSMAIAFTMRPVKVILTETLSVSTQEIVARSSFHLEMYSWLPFIGQKLLPNTLNSWPVYAITTASLSHMIFPRQDEWSEDIVYSVFDFTNVAICKLATNGLPAVASTIVCLVALTTIEIITDYDGLKPGVVAAEKVSMGCDNAEVIPDNGISTDQYLENIYPLNDTPAEIVMHIAFDDNLVGESSYNQLVEQ